MFYFPDQIVAIIPRVSKVKATYEGLCLDDFVKCRIPCSYDDIPRKWIGPQEKRVEINGRLSVIKAKTTERYLVVGTGLILKDQPDVIWMIEEIGHNRGVFGSNQTFDFMVSKHGNSVPPTGNLREYLDEF